MNQRIQIYSLLALAAILAFVVYTEYFSGSDVPGLPGVTTADTSLCRSIFRNPSCGSICSTEFKNPNTPARIGMFSLLRRPPRPRL